MSGTQPRGQLNLQVEQWIMEENSRTTCLSLLLQERALDTHIYQAWRDPDSRIGYYNDACAQKHGLAAMEREFGPVIVGEW